jgi:membrane protein DedA with SNARE-associated domain
MSFEEHLAHVRPLLSRYSYGAVFIATFVEGFGIPAPGQTLLVAAALLAGRGDFSLALVLLTAGVASMLGGIVGWFMGRAGGRRMLLRIASGHALARVEGLFLRWGRGVVALGRFVDGVRQLNAIAAGALGMSFASFCVWNALGALVWTSFWGLGAYLLGRDFEIIMRMSHRVRPVAIVVSTIVVVSGAAWLVYERRSRSRLGDRGDP